MLKTIKMFSMSAAFAALLFSCANQAGYQSSSHSKTQELPVTKTITDVKKYVSDPLLTEETDFIIHYIEPLDIQNATIFSYEVYTYDDRTSSPLPKGTRLSTFALAIDGYSAEGLVQQGSTALVYYKRMSKEELAKKRGAFSTNFTFQIDPASAPHEFLCTGEVTVIPKGGRDTIVTNKNDYSNCSDFTEQEYSDENAKYFGVFTPGRTVILDAFAMGRYEVTADLYNYVMNDAQNGDVKPASAMGFVNACIFCNEYTKLVFGDDTEELCYYCDEAFTIPLTSANSNNGNIVAVPYWDTSKKGYRLPTEAEWEYAARGGTMDQPDWNCMYPGMQCAQKDEGYNPYTMGAVAWVADNTGTVNGQGDQKQEVGLLLPNRLGMYDMSGNIAEMCYDYFDEKLPLPGTYVNPYNEPKFTGSSILGAYKGGSWAHTENFGGFYKIWTSGRANQTLNITYTNFGFRVCRSL